MPSSVSPILCSEFVAPSYMSKSQKTESRITKSELVSLSDSSKVFLNVHSFGSKMTKVEEQQFTRRWQSSQIQSFLDIALLWRNWSHKDLVKDFMLYFRENSSDDSKVNINMYFLD